MATRFDNVPSWTDWSKKSSSFLQKRANKPKLVAIDTLVKQYIPGQRGPLVQLSDALLDWACDKIDREADTGRLEALCALEEVVQRKLRDLERGGQKYASVACIAYQIQTGEFQSKGLVKYRGFDITSVGGKLDITQEARIDINDRANLMKQAIRLAHTRYTTAYSGSSAERADAIRRLGNRRGTADEQEQRVLKLFVAPEFYFRGKRGAYPIEMLWEVLPKIREETGDAKYQDWLFVPGSCVCHTVKTDKKDTKEEGLIMDNFAMVQKGNYGGSDGVHDLYIEKEFVSGIDYRFLGGKVAMRGDTDLHRALEPEVTPKKASAPIKERGRGGCIFQMDGITFGLEVCLDHGEGRLMQATDKGGVQIHLIPSAGMSIDRAKCAPNAIVFNVDSKHTELIVTDGKTQVQWETEIDAPADTDLFPADGIIRFAKPLRIP